MSESPQEIVDRLLNRVRAGDEDAFEQLFPLVYNELRALAEQQRRQWRGDDTLNTTALVHEAYLRLAGQSAPAWQNAPHFMAVASRAMRQILLDYAKWKHRAKRGGQMRAVPLDEIESALKAGGDASGAVTDALVALDVALQRLDREDPMKSRIVECRFFGDMPIADTATALGVSPATVKRGWAMAQAWLYRELERELGKSA